MRAGVVVLTGGTVSGTAPCSTVEPGEEDGGWVRAASTASQLATARTATTAATGPTRHRRAATRTAGGGSRSSSTRPSGWTTTRYSHPSRSSTISARTGPSSRHTRSRQHRTGSSPAGTSTGRPSTLAPSPVIRTVAVMTDTRAYPGGGSISSCSPGPPPDRVRSFGQAVWQASATACVAYVACPAPHDGQR